MRKEAVEFEKELNYDAKGKTKLFKVLNLKKSILKMINLSYKDDVYNRLVIKAKTSDPTECLLIVKLLLAKNKTLCRQNRKIFTKRRG